MASTCSIVMTYWDDVAGTSVDYDYGTSTGNLFNFMATDNYDSTLSESNPVQAGSNSYEIFIRAQFGGTFSNINNVQFWNSSGSLGSETEIMWAGNNVSYSQATDAVSSIATVTIPTTDPATANVSIEGSLGGTITGASGTNKFTDYIVLQAQIGGGAAPGTPSPVTFQLQYDEN